MGAFCAVAGGRSAALRDQYRRFSGDRPRWGILLEDLDTLAVSGWALGLWGGVGRWRILSLEDLRHLGGTLVGMPRQGGL